MREEVAGRKHQVLKETQIRIGCMNRTTKPGFIETAFILCKHSIVSQNKFCV